MTNSYLANPLGFIIETVLYLYMMIIALRLIMPWIHWNFSHPLPQIVFRATEPAIRPIRQIFPRMGRLDIAVLVLLLFVTFVKITLVNLIYGATVNLLALFPLVIAQIISLFVLLFTVSIIIEVLLSWLSPPGTYNPVQDMITRLNAPLLSPIRRKMPQTAGFDLSPLVAIIGLQVFAMLIIPLLNGPFYF